MDRLTETGAMTNDGDSLKPFSSDGCSVIGPIVRALGYRNANIRDCCLEHDRAYWKGGPIADKREADRKFRQCLSRRGYPKLAWLMWAGVAIGGFIPHPNFRWGFGWEFPKYKNQGRKSK